MPLRALIDDIEIISTYLTSNDWDELKDRIKQESLDVIISQTEKKGYLRTSKNGLQHFVHKKGEAPEDYKTESPQLLFIKSQILLGCKEAGWDAISEYEESKWSADVLAINGKNRIAFQVQWSPCTYEKTIAKQKEYKEDSVRGCWFFKNPPKELRDWDKKPIANKDIPLFKIIEAEDKSLKVDFNNQLFEISEFVFFLLSRKIKFCSTMKAREKQSITINFYKKSCWKCGANQHSYFLSETVKSICGEDMYLESVMWENDAIEFSPVIQNAIKEFLLTDKGKNIKIGKIKKRFSKTVGHSYMSFGCVKCDAIFGGWHNHEEIMEVKMYGADIAYEVELELPIIREEREHWCLNKSKEFCE
ncbi:hypothetical protein C7448_105175 [Tenacibaculum gallaicum]|uniref:Competence protein CoiA-like protein n=1 Tax=Tenacibaculum gallaicum TaxID=561505 RepID=A0A3E0HQQ1_9FLAO|nr:hypothetical protein [Tenacibaculum gallaicum]REH48892.1 hypothetical protein C7448_105175 [Tenacibaculum gallaicum]